MTREIKVFEQADGRWRWTYRDGDLELEGNQSFPTKDDAQEAASTAYPHVAIKVGASHRPQRRRQSTPIRILSFLLITTVVWRRLKSS